MKRKAPIISLAHFGVLTTVIFVFLSTAGAGTVSAAEIQIESPEFSFDQETGIYQYAGAKATIGDLLIEADVLQISTKTRILEATGRVRFTDGKVTGSARRIVLDTDSGTATLYEAEVFDTSTGFYLSAEKLVRDGPGHYQATNCSFTNCSPRSGGWRIEASTLNYQADDFAIAENAVLKLGGVPVLWSPVFAWPTVEKRRSGFLAPLVAVRTSTLHRFDLGTQLNVPYFLALDFDHDLTVTPEYYTERGTGLHLSYRYSFTTDMNAELELWGIQETISRDLGQENDILPSGELQNQDSTPSRFWMRWGHNQGIGEESRFVANVAKGSDGQGRREYEEIQNYAPFLDYQTTVSRQAQWGSAVVTAEHVSEFEQESLFANNESFTDGDKRPQILPRVSYTGGWQSESGHPLGLELSAFMARFITVDGASGLVRSASPAVSYPVRIGGSLELRPTLERRFTRYTALDVAGQVFDTEPEQRFAWLQDAESLGNEAGFEQWLAEIELRGPVARRFDQEEGDWEAFKHRVTPRLIYQEIEDVAQPLAGLLLRPDPALKLVTLRLDNAFLALPRATDALGRKNPSSIAEIDLIQRYDLLRGDKGFEPEGPPLPEPGETERGEPLLPAILEARWGGRGYSTDLFLRYHHQLSRFVEYRIGLRGNVSSRGTMRITYSDNETEYVTPDNKLHPAAAGLGFASTIAGPDWISYGFDGAINLRNQQVPLDRRITRAGLFTDYHPGCYAVRLSYLEQVGVTREFDRDLGRDVPVFFVSRQILLTFTIGGVATASRGIFLSTE